MKYATFRHDTVEVENAGLTALSLTVDNQMKYLFATAIVLSLTRCLV